MANIKKITLDWTETGITTYAIIRREIDLYRLNDADGTFTSAPADPYISLSEDTIIKGRYELNESRTVWNDGKYTIAVYKQSGVSPTPVNDIIIGSGQIYISSDTEIDITIVDTRLTETRAGYLENLSGGAAALETSVQNKKFANGYVYIEGDYGSSGTTYPLGEVTHPVSNINNAKTIADNNKLSRFNFNKYLSLSTDMNWYSIDGVDPYTATLAMGSSASNVTVRNARLNGDMQGLLSATDCIIDDADNDLNGDDLIRCLIGSIYSPMLIGWANMYDCTIVNGAELDLSTDGDYWVNFNAIRMGGRFTLINSVANTHVNLNLQGATVEIAPSCAEPNTTWRFSGVGKIINTAGLTNIEDNTVEASKFELTSAYDAAKTALQSGGSVVASNMVAAPPDISNLALETSVQGIADAIGNPLQSDDIRLPETIIAAKIDIPDITTVTIPVTVLPKKEFAIMLNLGSDLNVTPWDSSIIVDGVEIPIIADEDFTITCTYFTSIGWVQEFKLLNTLLITDAMMGKDIKLNLNYNTPPT